MATPLKSPESTLRDKAVILFQFALPLTIWAMGTALLGWQVLVFGLLVPILIANFLVICYIATNHFLNPLADEDDVLATSLSVTLPKWLSWLDPLIDFARTPSHHLFPRRRQAPAGSKGECGLWPDRYHSADLHAETPWDTPWVSLRAARTTSTEARAKVATLSTIVKRFRAPPPR